MPRHRSTTYPPPGGGVAALLTHTIMTTPALRRAALRHAPRVSCVAIAPPAVACPALAAEMRPYVTSVIKGHDIVPHCSLGQVARLRREVGGFARGRSGSP